MADDVQTRELPSDEWKRGPGGNWFRYAAWRDSAPTVIGYGCTAREARNDLERGK